MLLAHLSDTHLTTGVVAGGAAERARQALARVQGLDPRLDCVVVTGDFADHGDPVEYEAALGLLGGLDLPVHIATRRCPPWWPCITTRSRAASPPWTGPC
jgi:3',5'-cyclic AMP phosphodiesterase CpdA